MRLDEAEGAAPERRPLRLFVACDLPMETLEAIAAWQAREIEPRSGLRVTRALHLTLSSLGDTDPDLVPRIVAALREVSWRPCPVRVEDVVFLPRKGPRRVVALALRDEDGGLRALQSRVGAALGAAGLPQSEGRPWLPHVTVARYRRPGQPFPLQNVTIPGFCVVRMALYSSSLESAGAVHTSLAVFSAS